jgi:type II secretory pathway pseudopilin PulG
MTKRRRGGYTLVELVASLASAAALLLGLGGALAVTLRATDIQRQQALSLRQTQLALQDLARDIQSAQIVPERGASAMTLSVADRNANGSSETIRYAWSGSAGSALVRELNGTSADWIDDVHYFNAQYTTSGGRLYSVQLELQIGSDPRARLTMQAACLNLP